MWSWHGGESQQWLLVKEITVKTMYGAVSSPPVSNPNLPQSYDMGIIGAHLWFDVPRDKPGGVTLGIELYRCNGSLVRSLVCGQVSAGRHVIMIAGPRTGCGTVAPGLYLIRMHSGNYEKTLPWHAGITSHRVSNRLLCCPFKNGGWVC